MKTILIAAALVCTTVFAAPIREIVPIQLGAKAFRDGDAIQIEEVRSTSPDLGQGDTITVKGNYRLGSKSKASLQLLVTQTEGDGSEKIEAMQTFPATHGFEPFEVTITVKHRGYLHLTFYDTESGQPFGGTYFGTEKQMNQAAGVSVSHYLE